MMDWQRVNTWTSTLYTIVHALNLAEQAGFEPLDKVHASILAARGWIKPECSFASTLTSHPFGKRKVTFRLSPLSNFDESTKQIVKMLIQDLTVIFDEMMDGSLEAHGFPVPSFPQSKVEKLSTLLDKDLLDWSRKGCLELIAVRNALTHGRGRWNEKSIKVIESFVDPLPIEGDPIVVGIPMLFRYRKAIRTFLNATKPSFAIKSAAP